MNNNSRCNCARCRKDKCYLKYPYCSSNCNKQNIEPTATNSTNTSKLKGIEELAKVAEITKVVGLTKVASMLDHVKELYEDLGPTSEKTLPTDENITLTSSTIDELTPEKVKVDEVSNQQTQLDQNEHPNKIENPEQMEQQVQQVQSNV